jgi:hypothetical protein
VFVKRISDEEMNRYIEQLDYTPEQALSEYKRLIRNIKSEKETYLKCIDTESTKTLYQMALDKHPQAKYIYIISDNAKYYRNKTLTQWLEGTKIKPIFLPAYSPNLNLIERLWRFMKKKVINTNSYRTKELFRLTMWIYDCRLG